MAKDPVCGMEVDEKKAKFRLVSKGRKYFFCSKNCHDEFNKKKALPENALNEKQCENSSNNFKKNNFNNGQIKKIILPIKGMHCASCAATIEKSLKRLKGVSSANVNFASEKAAVDYDANA